MNPPTNGPFLKDKMNHFAAENSPEPPGGDARARKETRSGLSKVLKRAASIAEMLDENDAEENLRVIREAKVALHRVYSKEAGGLVEVPDHKTRLAAVALDLSYREGLPVQRQVQATVEVEDQGEYFKRALQSPALRRHLQSMLDQRNPIEQPLPKFQPT